jgi:ABC-type polysaccharide/polyol phosphate export permease
MMQAISMIVLVCIALVIRTYFPAISVILGLAIVASIIVFLLIMIVSFLCVIYRDISEMVDRR